MRKSQVSIELITLIALLVVFYILINIFSQNKKIDLVNIEDYLDRKNECLRVSSLITGVYNSGNNAVANTNVNNVITVYKDGIIEVNKKAAEETVVAYYGCHANEFEDGVGLLLSQKYIVDRYDNTQCNNPANFNNLLNNINKYNLIFLEDPHLGEGSTCCTTPPWNLAPLQDFVSNGGALMISEHVIKGSNNQAVLFGAKLHQNLLSGGTNPATVVQTDPTFPSLTLGTNLYFKDRPAMSPANFINIIPKPIANYTNNRMGIVSWDYGSGKLTFFSDFVEESALDFPPIVLEHIEETVRLLIKPGDSASCKYIGKISSEGRFSGNIRIRNSNNEIILENV